MSRPPQQRTSFRLTDSVVEVKSKVSVAVPGGGVVHGGYDGSGETPANSRRRGRNLRMRYATSLPARWGFMKRVKGGGK